MECKYCDKEITRESAIPLCEYCIEARVLDEEREAIKDLIANNQRATNKHKLFDVGTSFLTLGAIAMVALSVAENFQSKDYLVALAQLGLSGIMIYNQCRMFEITRRLERGNLELVGLEIQIITEQRKEVVEKIITGEIELEGEF